MADVNTTITSTGGVTSPYGSLNLADADDFGCSAGQSALCEYAEAFADTSLVDITSTVPSSIVISVQEAYRHDGVEGSGALLSLSSTSSPIFDVTEDCTIEFLEFDFNNSNSTIGIRFTLCNGTLRNCLVHGISANRTGACYLLTTSGTYFSFNIYGNIFTDLVNSSSGASFGVIIAGANASNVYNNTVRYIGNTGTGDSVGIRVYNDSDHSFINNVVSDITSDSGTAEDYDFLGASATFTYNTSEDATGNDQETLSFDSNHFLTAEPTNGGTDLGPGDWDTDITGRDRDVEGDDPWTRGAYQFVSQGSLLSINDISQSQTIDVLNLTQANILLINNIDQSQSLDTINLTQQNILVIQNLLQGQTIENINLAQQSVLVIDDVSQNQTIDNIVLSLPGFLEIQNITQAQTIKSINLSQQNVLVVSDLIQNQTIDNLTLSLPVLLQIADLVQNQNIGAVNLIQQINLTIDDIEQSQTLEGIVLDVGTILAIQDIVQSQVIDQLNLIQQNLLVIDDITQSQVLDNIDLIISQFEGKVSVRIVMNASKADMIVNTPKADIQLSN